MQDERPNDERREEECLGGTGGNPTPAVTSHRKLFYWKIALGVLLVVIGCWLIWPSGARARTGHESPAISVAAAKVIRTNLSLEQTFDAEFRPYEEIELHAKATGFVVSILVDVGDTVTNGQLLATLEIPELEDEIEHAVAVEKRNQEEVKKAQAEYEQTHIAYTRLAAVDKAKPHLIAQQDIDLAAAKDQAADAALETAKQQIQVSISEVKKLRTMLKYSRITAPFGGVVTKRFTDPGALIHGGNASSSPLLRLSQNDRLRLVFPVSVSFVPLIQIGESVEIRVPSVHKTFRSKVSRFTRKVETATRTMEVEAEVLNPDLMLTPGMYASVTIILEHRDNALVVPIEALSRQATTTVLLVNENKQIQERKIQPGMETATQVEVLDGLREGDLVLIGSHTSFIAGQKVVPKILEKNIDE